MNEDHVRNSPHLSTDVDTEQRTFPAPRVHQLAGMMIVNDFEHPDSIYDAVADGYRNAGGQQPQQVVSATEYQFPDVDTDTEYIVTTTASEWTAGYEQRTQYEPATEYAVTVRDGDPHGDDLRTAAVSLSVKVTPQHPSLVYPDGRSLSCPFGHGTRLTVQTSFVTHPTDLITRAASLLEHTFECSVPRHRIHPDSTRFWHAELYHRITTDRLGDLAQTLRRTQELIPMEGGPVDTGGRHDGDTWAEVYVTSRRWDLLGFPALEYPVQLKLYRAKYPDSAPPPMTHPKLEARLQKPPDTDLYHFDAWPDVKAALAAPVFSHLAWAKVGADDLVADRVAVRQSQATWTWDHPLNRREQLRRHYESLETDLYRAATRNTSLRDLLAVLVGERQAGKTVTYDQLAEKTGLSVRSVRKYVAELVDAGICLKRRSRRVTVQFVSQTVRQKMDSILNRVQEGDTVGDRVDRATRRETDDDQ